MTPLLNAKQVGELLGISPRMVYALASSGAIPSFRFGTAAAPSGSALVGLPVCGLFAGLL